MHYWHPTGQSRAEQYASSRGLLIVDQLGWGQDGVVFDTDAESAIKVLKYSESYTRERDAYIRLDQRDVGSIHGFAVPQLIDYDDQLLVVEMGKVSPPCILDFASSTLDAAPHVDAQAASWWRKQRRDFGKNWPIAAQCLVELRKHGIFMNDVNPRNIIFPA